jgi:hypothetical protein
MATGVTAAIARPFARIFRRGPVLLLPALGGNVPRLLFGLLAQISLPIVLVADVLAAFFFLSLWRQYRLRNDPRGLDPRPFGASSLSRRGQHPHGARHHGAAVSAVPTLVGDPEKLSAALALSRIVGVVAANHRVPHGPEIIILRG